MNHTRVFKLLSISFFGIACVVSTNCTDSAKAQTMDPLPSWNKGSAKAAIIDFVNRVTDEDSPDYVAPVDRIATFDNDGCLWSEKPFYFQLAFVIDRIRELAKDNPSWKDEQPFQAVLDNDLKTLSTFGVKELLQLVTASHAGMSQAEFSSLVGEWLNNAKHPRFNRPYSELVFKPMLELLEYLRDNEFKTFMVTGGGIDFVRVFAEKVYGIPADQIVGSQIKTRFEIRDGKPVIVRLPEIHFIDDKEGKPIGIDRHIGKRPIAAFGNSDGDLQMLQYTAAGEGARFCLLVHHTDAEREWAYDRKSHVGRLDKALDEAQEKGWTVVDMKSDWRSIYPADHHYLHKNEKPHTAEWSYDGKTGPEHWGDLDPTYVLAKNGKHQSPIDIRSSQSANLPEINFEYKPSRIHLIYNGHTIQENEDPGSFEIIGNRRYQLQQFHFHSPSEHTVDGKHYPMEMHLVHKSATGSVGVVAVFIEEGKHNQAFDPAWTVLPDAESPRRDLNMTIDTLALLPKDHSYYQYFGSFTTPPCTEQVNWVVLKTPISLSKQQIERFRSVIKDNNRPVQPLNDRRVLRSK